MGSRYLLWVFLFIGLFLGLHADVDAQKTKDGGVYYTCGGPGAFITGQQLLAGSKMPSGLNDDITWDFPPELTAVPTDNTALNPVISGFVMGSSYVVDVKSNSSGHTYRITINASESIGPYELTSLNGTEDVLLDNDNTDPTKSYPVPFNLSATDGNSYQYYYTNGDAISGTSGPLINPNPWSFDPTNQTEVYSVYGVVNKTVKGLACKAKSNEIQIADEKVELEVVGGGSICDGATTDLPLSVKPYDDTYTYTWYNKYGAVVGTGDSYTIDRSGGDWTGAYSVVVTDGTDVIATSEDVKVGAYELTAGLIANGPTAFCGDVSAELTGSAVSTEGNNLDYRWERSGTAVSAGSGFIASSVSNPIETETYTTTGSYRFVVRESDNPLCFAQSDPVVVESTIEANPLPVTGSSVCEGSSINNITLPASEAGVTYRLMYDNGSGTKVMVHEWDSEGTPYTFPSVSDVGSYTVEATGCSGVVQMTGGPFVISALPDETLDVVLNGSECEGDSHTVTVQGSEAGVSYQLFRGATPASLVTPSTGGDLTFSGVTDADDYTVRATRNGCTVTLDQGVRIGVVPAAQTFSPSTACAGTPFTLTLANSEAGVQYTIYNAANVSLYSQNSPGGPLSFTVNQDVGTYTIVAENGDGCTFDIGSFTLQAPPITTYTLQTAATPACQVNGPHTISLSSSQPGFIYRLLRGATVVSSVEAPAAGGILDLASTSVAGTYTVEVSNGGCMLPMPTSLTIVAQPNDIPVVAGDFCHGDDVEVRLNSSQSGAIYRLYRDGIAYASEVVVSVTGGAIVFADKFPPGEYSVGASFVSGACERIMTGRVVVNPLPNPGINSGSFYCADAGTIQLIGEPAAGLSSYWSINGVTGSVPWFTHAPNNPLAQVVVQDLIDARVGAGTDRAEVIFNYHFTDENGCAATASKPITFVADQSDNIYARYSLNSDAGLWSDFGGDLLTCQEVDEIYLGAFFIAPYGAIGSGVFSTNAPTGSITNAGAGDVGAAIFHPSVSGNGLWAVTYTYIDPASGCEADITYNIQVGTTLSLHSLNPVYCKSDASFSFYGDPGPGLMQVFYEDESDPAPREQTGNGSGNAFNVNPSDPAWLAGNYLVRYTHTVDGCENVIENTFSILEEVDASFTIDNGPQYCTTGAAVELIPTQSGGTFSIDSPGGVGVTPNGPKFFLYPDQLPPDEYELTYTIQTGSCSDSKSTTVIVVEPDQIDISNLLPTYCQGVADFDIWVNNPTAITGAVYTFTATANAGGRAPIYLSDVGDLDGTGPVGTAETNATSLKFSPSYVGPGTYYITYTFDNTANAGCISTITKEVRVLPVPGVDFGVHDPVAGTTHTTLEFCQNADPVYLKGDIFSHPSNPSVTGTGYFVGVGIDNEANGYAADDGYALFDPSVVTAGDNHTITYRYTHHNGCVSERTREFDILPAPIRQRVTPVNPNDGIFCEGETGVTIGLLGTQLGVSYYLYKDGVIVPGQEIIGSAPENQARYFSEVSEEGLYTVRAVMAPMGPECKNLMDGEVIVRKQTVIGVLENRTNETCAGSDNGSVTFSAYGGVAPYTYTLQQGGVDITTSASGTFGGLAPETYTVHIEDAVGCDWTSAGFEIKAGSSISVVSENEIDVVCFGESNGAFTVVATGLPSGNYEFLLSGSSDWLANGTGRYVFNNLPAGTYDVTVRDADNPGCQAVMTPSVEIEQPTEAVYMAVGAVTDITCSLEAEGEIAVMAAGGNDSGDFDYVLYREMSPGFWVNIKAGTKPAGTPHVFEDLFAGNYRVVAIDPDACSVTEEYTVDGPASLPTITLSGDEIVHESQPGLSDGSIQIAITGGEEPYSIVWSGLAPDGITPITGLTNDVYRQENLSAGTYSVTVTDDNNCPVTLSDLEVLDDAVSAFDLTYTTVNPGPCFGSTNGRINLRAVGGITPYLTLTLTNSGGVVQTAHSAGNSFANYENLPAGNYTATVVDGRGVSLSETIELTQPAAPVALSHAVTDATCFGENGNLVFSATGGVPFTGTAPALDYYNFSILPASGIAITGTIEVGETIDVQADLPATEQLPAGTYQLTVTDAVSCFAVHNFTISQPDALTIQVVDRQHNLCHGASEGSITVAVDGRPGGTAFDFEWERYDEIIPAWVPYFIGTSASISNLAAGTYRVKATETAASSCESDFSGPITIGQPAVALAVVATPSDISTCNGDATGSVRLSVTGGTAPYTIAYGTEVIPWNGLNDYVVTGLVAGSYDFTITDDNGCFVEESAIINEPALFEASVVGSGITCEMPNTGWIDLNVSGGVDTNGAAAGGFAYQVRVIRQENNQVFHNQSHSDPALSIGGLQQGTYTIMVWDANSTATDRCSHTFEVELRNVVINANIVHPTCSGLDNGSIEAIVTGGSGDFSYAWTGPGTFTSNQPLIDDLEPGTYELKVTDLDNGNCTLVRSYDLAYSSVLAVDVDYSDEVSCHGGSDGWATALPSGGTAPYFFLWERQDGATWTPLTNTATLSNRTAGTYRVTVTDANGCEEVSANVVIGEPAEFSVASITYNRETVSCNGGTDGSFTVNMDRAGNFEYSIDAVNWQILPTFEGLAPGSYRISVRDMDQPAPYCAKYEVETATILEADPVVVSLDNQVNVNCFGGDTGALTVSASGGTGPYTYQWFAATGTGNIPLAGETNAAVTGLVAGEYYVQVWDNNICLTTSEVYTLTQPADQLVVSEFSNQPVSAYDGNDGSITVAITGGTSGYSIAWTGTDYELNDVTASLAQNDVTLNNLKAGVYIATVTDNVGCTDDVSITVSQPGDALTLSEILTHPQPCNGATNGSIELTAAGGVQPYTFTLIRNPVTDVPVTSVSGNKATFANLSAGFYTARVRDANGNVFELPDLELIQPDPVEIHYFAATNISCFGAADGSINFSISGGTPDATNGYSYILRPENGTDIIRNGDVNITETGLVPDNYTLLVYDASNVCFAEHSFTLTQPSEIILTETITPVSCNGLSDGSIRINVSGGIGGGYTYEWFVYNTGTSLWDAIPGSNTAWLQNQAAGRYYVEVTELGGATCSKESVEFVLSEPAVLTATATPFDVNTCPGDNSGRITVVASGGVAPYVVNYGTGTQYGNGPEFFIEGLVADDYTIVVTDNNGSGCQTVATATVREPAEALSVTTPVVSYSCALPPLPPAETYSVAFDINGGVGITNGTDDEFSYFIEVTNLLTSGKKTKTVTATTIDQPVTVNLDDLNLGYGSYRLVVSDAQAAASASCAAVEHLFSISGITVTDVISPVSCPGAADGSIDITVTGGSDNFDYAWTWVRDGIPMTANSQDLSGLSAGSYTLTITDLGQAGRCPVTRTYIVSNAKTLVVEASVSPVKCFGGSDGAIRITGVASAAPGLSYFWNGSAVAGTNELTGLAAGGYSVEIIDGDGCSVTETFTVTQPNAALSVALTAALDCASDTRTITAEETGGTGPFTASSFAWSGPGAFTRSVDGRAISNITVGGEYTVQVTDAYGCSVAESIVIDGAITLTADVTSIDCNSGSGGNIVLNVAGGSGDYSYVWTKDALPFAQATKDIVNLEAGVYEVTVTDNQQDCNLTTKYSVSLKDIVVTQPAPIQIAGVVTNNECYGSAEGRINISVSGGTAPYDYIWTTMNGSGLTAGVGNQSGLTAGTYTLQVRDSKGCLSATQEFPVTELPELVFDLVVSDTNCANNNSIQITNADGGSENAANYLFVWDGPGVDASTPMLQTDLPGGTYTITMVDMGTSARCSYTQTVELTRPLELSAVVQPESCSGSNNGVITLDVTGGTAPYNFVWDVAPGIQVNDRNQAALPAGTYNVTVTDSRAGGGCPIPLEVIVPLQYDLELQAAIDDVECFGGSNGAIYVTVLNGSGDYTYQWTKGAFSATSEDIEDLEAGDYTLQVTDNVFGCTVTGVSTVEQPAAPMTISVVGVTDNDCFGDTDGAIDIDVTGGTAPYTYQWTGPGNLLNPTNQDQTDLSGGDYYVSVTDANGCEISNYGPIPVAEPATPVTISLLEVTPVTALNAGDGTITIQISGGSGSYTSVTWLHDGGDDMSAFVDQTYADELAGGTYTIHAEDANGCDAEEFEVFVYEPGQALELDIEKQASGPCYGSANGKIFVSVKGGELPYQSLTLSDGAGTLEQLTEVNSAIFDNLVPGDYTVTIIDAFGTNVSQNVRISEATAPLAVTATVTTQVDCRGGATGVITARVTGGIPNASNQYRLLLSGGPAGTSTEALVLANADHTFNNLPKGTYTVRVIDDSNVLRVAHDENDLQDLFGNDIFSLTNDCSATVEDLIVRQPEAVVHLSVEPGSEEVCAGVAPRLVAATSGWDFADGDLAIVLSNGDDFVLTAASEVLTLTTLPLNAFTSYTIVSVTSSTDVACSKGEGTGQATVVMHERPTASLSGTTNVCAGETASLNLQLTGTAPWQVSYSDGTSTFWINDIATPTYQLEVSPTATTTYTVETVADANCTGAASGTATVTVPVVSTVEFVGDASRDICAGESEILEVAFDPASNGPWQLTYSAQPLVGGLPSGTPLVRTVTVDAELFNAVGNYEISVAPAQTMRYRLESVVSGGCAGTVDGLPIDVLVGQLPAQPGAIAGPVEVCQGAAATFSVPALPGVSHYVWTLPGGVEVESGRELTTTFAENAVSGRLSVYAVNACGDGPLQYMDITVNPLPDASTAVISGPEDICQGSKGVVFTVEAIPHAETYNWSLTVGTILSGQGSAQIAVDFADEVDHFNGVVSVQAENDCGTAVDLVSKDFRVRPLPVPNAGPDQLALCGNEVTLNATPLTAAELAAGAVGRWLSLPVVGSADPITDVTNPNVSVTGLSRGDVSFRWVVTSAYGCESYDEVTVRNNQLLVSAWAESAAVCNGTAQLRGTNPDVGLSVSGQWTVVEPVGFVAVFDNATSPSALVSNMSPGRNVFRWTLYQNGCASSAEVEIMNNQPAEAVINGPAVVSTCGDPVTLEAVAPGVDWGTGSWSVISGYAQIVSPNSATTVVQGMNFGDTELQWTVTKGHCQNTARVIIRNNKVWVDAGDEQDLCSASTVLDGSEVPAGASGSWHVISGAASFANGSNPATAVSALGRGENVLEWRINKNGCVSSDQVSIWNNSATAATVGSALTVCNELPTLSGNAPLLSGETAYWSVVSGSGTFVDASQHNTQVSDLAFGENVFRWTINNNDKCSSSADLRVTNLKTFVDAGKDTVICANPVILRANPVPAGMTGTWTIVPGEGGGTIVVDDPSRPNIIRVGLDQGPNTLEWTINNNGCYSTDRVVVVNSRPYPVDGGPARRVISGTTAFMEAEPPGARQTGTWLLLSGGADIVEPNNPKTEVLNLRRGENVFRWVVTNGYCSDYADVVIVNGDVVDANAGRNQVICGSTTRLDANDPEGALGAWTRVKGTAVFDNPYDPRTQVSNLAPGENILRWTISYGSSGSSTSSSDEVVIYNNQPATARTMDDVVLCDDNLTIRANVPGMVGSEPMGTPFWEIVSGAGDLADPNAPETLVENLAKGVNVLVYSITKIHETSNTTCVSRDTLEVINGLPTEPVAGEDQTICSNEYLLNPNIPEHGVGTWRSGSEGGATFDGNRVYNLAQGDNELIYEIATEWCSLESRIVLTNNKPSDSYAGRGRDVCDSTFTMEARDPQYGLGTWEKVSGGGVIAPEDLNDPEAQVSGLTSGSNRFRWVVDNKGCTSTSEVEIRYNFIAADAGDDFEICEDFTFLNGSNPMEGTGTWGVKGGSGSAVFEDINDPLTRVSGLDRGPNVLTWTVSNVNCSDVSEVTIYNNKPTIPDAGDDQSGLCAAETILQGNTPAAGVGRWTVVSGSATFHSDSYAVAEEDPNARVSDLSFGPNTLRWTISAEGQMEGYDGCSLYDEVVLTFNRVEAFAGNDRAACADEMVLSARNPSPGTGMWSVPGGQGAAVFEDPTSPNTRVYNLGRGQNTLRWTVWHNGCSTYDEVVIDNQLPSRPYAGNDVTLCKDNTVLDATAPEGGSTGRWRVVTGSAVFADETDPKTAVSGLSKGDNIFIWTTERIEGCVLEDEVLVQNHEPSDPYAGADYEEVCANTFTLKATAPEYGSGIWSFEAGGGNLSDPNDPEALITALNPGRNLLRWTVSQGQCSKWAEVEIINNTPTKANAGPDIEDCKDTQTLDANVPVHFERAYWERISGYGELDDINNPKSVVRNLAFGANEFQWVIENGSCRSTDRVVIFNQIPDKAFAGSDQLDVCDTYTVLNGNDPVTGVGKWSVLKGRGEFDDPHQYNTIVRNLGFGENIFLWEVTYGTCSTRDEMVVVSHKTEAYAGEDQVVYEPEVLLNANNAGELDAQWFVEGNSTAVLNDERFFNTSVSNLSAGINSFRWEINVNGCISSDRVSVDYRPVPDAGFIVDVEAGCYPLRVQFTNYSVGGSQYLWHFGDGSTSADRNPVHVYERPGTFTVQLVSPGPDGQDGLYEKEIQVFDHPVADFAVNPTIVYIPGEKARFYDLSTDAVSWWWDFGDGVLSEERNPSHEYQEEGVYDVALTVGNVEGCLDTLIVGQAITAEPQGFVVFPNAFRPRPGGASAAGVDPSAEYVVVFKPAYRDVDDFTLEIYNRWGQKIFETKDIDSGWDGMFEGQMAPQAVYVYKASGTYINGRSFKKSGSVLLVR